MENSKTKKKIKVEEDIDKKSSEFAFAEAVLCLKEGFEKGYITFSEYQHGLEELIK
jgi:hypothetical protein